VLVAIEKATIIPVMHRPADQIKRFINYKSVNQVKRKNFSE
jgi:hypothetical protein